MLAAASTAIHTKSCGLIVAVVLGHCLYGEFLYATRRVRVLEDWDFAFLGDVAEYNRFDAFDLDSTRASVESYMRTQIVSGSQIWIY